MYIIEAQKGKQLWISGVFKNREEADDYMIKIPEDLKQYQRQYRVEMEFPFYIVEKNGFEYVDERVSMKDDSKNYVGETKLTLMILSGEHFFMCWLEAIYYTRTLNCSMTSMST